MHIGLFPSPEFGYDDQACALFVQYADDLLKKALYEIWISILHGQKLVQPNYKGVLGPFQHPENELVSENFCQYVIEGWESRSWYQFPSPEEILPNGSPTFRCISLKVEVRVALICACFEEF
ncbi:hypothetical protein K440DRAFT_657727 [Wilcoxina mikolae CBS 423.85]|nr:hypothetical protein K440DRAFT_657727 [Wilcoxina mikolae CBS 423.85]